MRKSTLGRRGAAIILAAGAICAWAANVTGFPAVSLDPARTRVKWELDGNTHATHGTFKLKEANIQVDPSKGTVSGYVVIDAKSGDSGNSLRDKRMHREIIESDKYPEIRFTIDKVEGPLALRGESRVKVDGWLELHGQKHAVTIPAELKLSANQVTGNFQFEVPYVEWGMKDPSNFVFRVDKKVKIEVEASGTLAPSDQ